MSWAGMGWDGSSERYTPNALTVNKSLVFNIEKNLRVRRTDQTRQDQSDMYRYLVCV